MIGKHYSPRSLTRRRALGLAAGVPGLAVASAAAQAGTPVATPVVPPDFKVVLHAAQADHWQYVLSNLDNLRHEWPAARLRVVVDGTAVGMLSGDSDLTRALATAMSHGVAVFVCPNALREHGIAPEAMPPGVSTALGGVVALVHAANEGYVYVKP